ncbi:MAG TPA: hypothetical protein VGF28_08575 [Thermoanaerobaculia bacterium]
MRFLLLTALLPLMGSWVRCPSLPLAAKIPVWFACGLVTVTAEMFLLTCLGIPWSFALLAPLPILLAILAILAHRRRPPVPAGSTGSQPVAIPRWQLLIAATALLVLFSATVAAYLTSGDYVIFWGTKGQRFGQVRTLDVPFMKEAPPEMHPDYPPLVPFYYAWTMLGGDGAFDWWGGMLATPMFLALSVAAVYGYGRYAGTPMAAPVAALMASSFALFFMRNQIAGNAEAPLIFFETVALGALVCGRQRSDDLVAAIALAGVALTKVEGGVFIALVLSLSWLTRPGRWRDRFVSGVRVGILPVAALLAWLAFSHVHQLTEVYTGRSDLDVAYLVPTAKTLWRELSLRLAYTPWIAAVLIVLTGRLRNALPWLAASLGFVTFLLLIYMRADPHMEWSSGRVLMTAVLLAYFGGMAAHRREGVLRSS